MIDFGFNGLTGGSRLMDFSCDCPPRQISGEAVFFVLLYPHQTAGNSIDAASIEWWRSFHALKRERQTSRKVDAGTDLGITFFSGGQDPDKQLVAQVVASTPQIAAKYFHEVKTLLLLILKVCNIAPVMAKERVCLAYSGGLDTSCILAWLIEKGYEVGEL